MVLELGDSEVLGRGKVPSDSDYIALLRLADFEGFVNMLILVCYGFALCQEGRPPRNSSTKPQKYMLIAMTTPRWVTKTLTQKSTSSARNTASFYKRQPII